MSFGRGGAHRRIALTPGVVYALAAALPAIAAVYLGATAYLFFRDDMIAAIIARHAQQQYAYEDRLAALRLQIDRITGRQMLDQDSFDGKLREMVSRQARIETRAAVLAALGDVVGTTPPTPSADAAPKPGKPAFNFPWTKTRPTPAQAEAAAPIDNPEPMPRRPKPEDTGLRPSADVSLNAPAPVLTLADIAADDVPAHLRLGTLSHAIDSIERAQVATLRRLEAPAVALATKLNSVIAMTGLTADRLKVPSAKSKDTPAVGGPFVPVRLDGHASDFDNQLARTQAAVLSLDAVRRIIPALPLRRPLTGGLEQTSSFGYRLDPFLGRPAMHSGLDFRGEYGSPVRATAGGTVVTAGYSGGYGNLVEIEHANGVSTRYGHLSGVTVSEGQVVQPGAIVGRVGSTGRSTGNHLHYEVRIDDEAVDPTKFIRAANLLGADEGAR